MTLVKRATNLINDFENHIFNSELLLLESLQVVRLVRMERASAGWDLSEIKVAALAAFFI